MPLPTFSTEGSQVSFAFVEKMKMKEEMERKQPTLTSPRPRL